ncbi:MAG: Uma2 family endonuclease, partial [Flavisolibacter sp.]|nr:Uma2 family endonuclease [Flavisolibacter sp.]
YVYTPEGLTQTIDSFDEKLNGGDVLPGFELDLSVLK